MDKFNDVEIKETVCKKYLLEFSKNLFHILPLVLSVGD